ncbi:putative transcriptional regulator [Rubidibacter lacunae KORDI 51-2]|uniref:Putative transcriptional regulator n=1 Tax=Rubidibacter lacunae KORDI 51-2 TaxID=582515 RepID=U5DIH8_9CHRO|nr:PadR family transcriptional regulator [Rubidibacter lacunae]ERN40742.1 putative transcriptional regulator [Rubidibacter lacunae KORDI 51-2]
MNQTMDFEDIYRFFHCPPPTYLNRELAVCYVLDVLLRGESYGTELIELLERTTPGYRLSDTVLYGALKFLEESGTISGYWKKLVGRGRPRRMYQICPGARQRAEELACLWQSYISEHTGCEPKKYAIGLGRETN